MAEGADGGGVSLRRARPGCLQSLLPARPDDRAVPAVLTRGATRSIYFQVLISTPSAFRLRRARSRQRFDGAGCEGSDTGCATTVTGAGVRWRGTTTRCPSVRGALSDIELAWVSDHSG